MYEPLDELDRFTFKSSVENSIMFIRRSRLALVHVKPDEAQNLRLMLAIIWTVVCKHTVIIVVDRGIPLLDKDD